MCTVARAAAAINVRAWRTRARSWRGFVGGGDALLRRQRGVFPGSSLACRAFTCCSRRKIRYSHWLFLLTSLHAFKSPRCLPARRVWCNCTQGSWRSAPCNVDKNICPVSLYIYISDMSVLLIMSHTRRPRQCGTIRALPPPLLCFYIRPQVDPQVWAEIIRHLQVHPDWVEDITLQRRIIGVLFFFSIRVFPQISVHTHRRRQAGRRTDKRARANVHVRVLRLIRTVERVQRETVHHRGSQVRTSSCFRRATLSQPLRVCVCVFNALWCRRRKQWVHTEIRREMMSLL